MNPAAAESVLIPVWRCEARVSATADVLRRHVGRMLRIVLLGRRMYKNLDPMLADAVTNKGGHFDTRTLTIAIMTRNL